MAPRSRLCVPALLAAVSCVGGFILPSSGPTNRGTLRRRGCNGLPTVGGSPASSAHHHPHPRRDSRRSALGPDGNEIDIIRHREAYSYAEYWDDFYAGGEAGSLEDGESYDWFFGYSRLAVYLNLHVGGARAGRVLVLGCGNSEVSPKMWENGWKDIVSIDFCNPVIEAMQSAHADKPGMEWKVMDARDMVEFETGSFDAVIDKGLTDSVMYNDKFSVMMAKVSYEVARVLKPGGVYLMTDYRDPERVQELFERDEWEGGSLTQEGKITSKVLLFKGKRSSVEPQTPDFLEELIEEVEGDVQGEVLEASPQEDSQEWLADAIAQGTISIPDEGPADEVPHKDVGQDKPFKF
ncbi:unnamed protein product [Ectocarpus sp. 6 AP-2014]